MIDNENHIIESFKHENVKYYDQVTKCAYAVAKYIIETFNPKNVTLFMLNHERYGTFIEFVVDPLKVKEFFEKCEKITELTKTIPDTCSVLVTKHHSRAGTKYYRRPAALNSCGVVLEKNKKQKAHITTSISYVIELNNLGYKINGESMHSEYYKNPNTHVRVFVHKDYYITNRAVIYALINELVLFKNLLNNIAL